MRVPAHRRDFGWRASTVAGALRLRPAVAQITEAEGELIERCSTGARPWFRSASPRAARHGTPAGRWIPPDAAPHRHLPEVLGMNMSRSSPGGWSRACREPSRMDRARSDEAARGSGPRPIDFLFIDGDHTTRRSARDFGSGTASLPEAAARVPRRAPRCSPGWTSPSGSAALRRELIERAATGSLPTARTRSRSSARRPPPVRVLLSVHHELDPDTGAPGRR